MTGPASRAPIPHTATSHCQALPPTPLHPSLLAVPAVLTEALRAPLRGGVKLLPQSSIPVPLDVSGREEESLWRGLEIKGSRTLNSAHAAQLGTEKQTVAIQ